MLPKLVEDVESLFLLVSQLRMQLDETKRDYDELVRDIKAGRFWEIPGDIVEIAGNGKVIEKQVQQGKKIVESIKQNAKALPPLEAAQEPNEGIVSGLNTGEE